VPRTTTSDDTGLLSREDAHAAARGRDWNPAAGRPERIVALKRLIASRILVLDGAMGTMIQDHDLDEEGFAARGSPTIRARKKAITICCR